MSCVCLFYNLGPQEMDKVGKINYNQRSTQHIQVKSHWKYSCLTSAPQESARFKRMLTMGMKEGLVCNVNHEAHAKWFVPSGVACREQSSGAF